MIILGSPFGFVPGTMLSAIERLGLTSGLKLCLDASDINSYSGAGQSWIDTSGNGYDFYRGSGSGSDASDPTFNGSAGRQSSSEYWSFDGGDYFTYDSANEAWMNNVHKNNAKFAAAGWVWMGDINPPSAYRLCGTYDGFDEPGWAILLPTGTGRLRFSVANDTVTILTLTSTAPVSLAEDAWSFFAVLVDEAAGTGTLQVNATQEAQVTTYASPSSNAGSNTMGIGAVNATHALPSTSRMNSIVMWEGTTPAAADLLALYEATRGKFGL